MRYVLLLCRFRMFFEILQRFVLSQTMQGLVKKSAVFMLSPLTDWAIYAVALVFCYIVIFLTLFTAVNVIIFVWFTGVRIVNLSVELLFLRLAFCFFFWMIGELVRTSPGRFLVTLDGSELDILFLFESTVSWEFWSAFLSVKLGRVLMDGRMQERRRGICVSYLTHNIGT